MPNVRKSSYNYIRAYYGAEFRLLSPAMVQSTFAEGRNIDAPGCPLQHVTDQNGADMGKGYDNMRASYETANDGITWNNYFIQGGEQFALCYDGGWHVSRHFPSWMANLLQSGSKIGILTEVDLCSWLDPLVSGRLGQCQNRNSILNKDDNPTATGNSLRAFFANERLADPTTYMAEWVLNSDSSSVEENWHEAYQDDGTAHPWFRPWWAGGE